MKEFFPEKSLLRKVNLSGYKHLKLVGVHADRFIFLHVRGTKARLNVLKLLIMSKHFYPPTVMMGPPDEFLASRLLGL